MIDNKTRWLAGMALGCVLSSPTAFADDEEYRGFYFSLWGGQGSADVPSKGSFDAFFNNAWVQGALDDVAEAFNESPEANGVLTLAGNPRGPATLDDSTDVWGALVGYRINKYVGVEFGYVHLGEVKYDFDGDLNYTFDPSAPGLPTETELIDYTMGYRFSSTGPTAAVVGFLPAGKHFEFTGKAGIYLADTRETVRLYDVEFEENFFHDRTDASQTEIFAGIGATWNATENLAVRLEYQRFFNIGDDSKTAVEENVDVISLGVMFR